MGLELSGSFSQILGILLSGRRHMLGTAGCKKKWGRHSSYSQILWENIGRVYLWHINQCKERKKFSWWLQGTGWAVGGGGALQVECERAVVSLTDLESLRGKESLAGTMMSSVCGSCWGGTYPWQCPIWGLELGERFVKHIVEVIVNVMGMNDVC